MYKLKQIPEDFVVDEVNNFDFNDNDEYAYYLLKKVNYNTLDAINRVCEAWNINPKFVNFAGTKDKVAITTQYISISRGPKKDLELKDISLKYVGSKKERLNLGVLIGNNFRITVRNIKSAPKVKSVFVNYFDTQRFGVNNDNQIVGKHLLKSEFKEACSIIAETTPYLTNRPNDYVGALRSIPKKLLKLYLHAYQSSLWNKAAGEVIKNDVKTDNLEIIGFGTEFENEKVKHIYEKIMDEEQITFRDFINPALREISEEGTTRELFVTPKDLEISELSDDELNPGKLKIVLTFFLPPGAYATNIVKQLFE